MLKHLSMLLLCLLLLVDAPTVPSPPHTSLRAYCLILATLVYAPTVPPPCYASLRTCCAYAQEVVAKRAAIKTSNSQQK
jgi:hypothetical protein